MNIRNIDNWKLFLSLQDASEHMWDWGHRLNPKFHRPLNEVVQEAFDPGFDLDFDDGAIKAFFCLIDFPLNAGEHSICDIVSNMRQWAGLARKDGIHGFDTYSFSSDLLATKSESGWVHLDALFEAACGISLSRFFETAAPLYLPNEPGLGGDVCYRLKVGTGSEQDLHWVAVSSTLSGVLTLFRQALEGARIKSYLSSSDCNLTIVSASILRNHDLLFSVRMGIGDIAKPVWCTARILERDFELIKGLAGLAPEETIYSLKGRILEADLGL